MMSIHIVLHHLMFNQMYCFSLIGILICGAKPVSIFGSLNFEKMIKYQNISPFLQLNQILKA